MADERNHEAGKAPTPLIFRFMKWRAEQGQKVKKVKPFLEEATKAE
jgi:hypothetical protein